MTVNSYLTNIAKACILRDERKRQIQTSVTNIQTRIKNYFGDDITNQIVFGSYSRGTSLPRIYDQKSDVDLMIVFRNGSYQPQTYLDQLRRFVMNSYSTSEIKQSNPTIQLTLNHITFELIPALDDSWINRRFKIPAPSFQGPKWITTDPNDFDETLQFEQKKNNNLAKPIVRVLKYWNASSNYPFESYDLEKQTIIESQKLFGSYQNLSEYFYSAVPSLSLPIFAATYKKDKLQLLKKYTSTARYKDSIGDFVGAEKAIMRVIKTI